MKKSRKLIYEYRQKVLELANEIRRLSDEIHLVISNELKTKEWSELKENTYYTGGWLEYIDEVRSAGTTITYLAEDIYPGPYNINQPLRKCNIPIKHHRKWLIISHFGQEKDPTIKDLSELTVEEFFSIKGVGKKAFIGVQKFLNDNGLDFKNE